MPHTLRARLLAATVLVTGSIVLAAALPSSSLSASPFRGAATVLPGSSPSWAASRTPSGAVPGSERISLSVLLPWAASDADNISTTAPIASAAFARRYATDPDELSAVADWLASERLSTVEEIPAAGVVRVTGAAADVERAFSTALATFTRQGQSIIAPTSAVSVPTSMAGRIENVSGLVAGSTYSPSSVSENPTEADARVGVTSTKPIAAPTPPRAGAGKPLSPKTTSTSTKCAPYWGEQLSGQWPASVKANKKSNWICGYTPNDLRAIHDVPSAARGQGSTIGIIAAYDDPTVEANTNTYFSHVGAAPLRAGQYVHHSPTESDESICGGPSEWAIEQQLDVQAAHAMAPDADIAYWGAGDCTAQSLFSTLLTAVQSGVPDVLSLSFGSTEETDTIADNQLLNRALVQAALTGISVFAASGNDGDYADYGDHGGEIQVTSPASSAYVTAVGGTSIGLRRDGTLAVATGWETTPHFARNGGLIPPGFDAGAGGGVSAVYGQPTWQRVVPGLPRTGRAVPDVASLSDPNTGFTVYAERDGVLGYQSIGGTSLATPMVASMVAIAKAATGVRVGLAAPWLYKLRGTAAIRDVTPESAAVWSIYPADRGQTWPETIYTFDRKPQSLQSATGWDPVTGLGIPRGDAFISAFGKP